MYVYALNHCWAEWRVCSTFSFLITEDRTLTSALLDETGAQNWRFAIRQISRKIRYPFRSWRVGMSATKGA